MWSYQISKKCVDLYSDTYLVQETSWEGGKVPYYWQTEAAQY